MEKKKLLVTASTFPRWNGDTEPRFVLDLCIGLNKYFDVTVLVPMCPNAKEEEYLEGVQVIRYHYFPIHKWETLCYPGAIVPRIKEKKIRIFLVPFLFLGLILKLFKILPQYDYVHAHWIIPQGIIQSFFKKTYLITSHGGDITSMNKGIMKRLKKWCLENASHITVVSNSLKEIVVQDYKINPEKVDIISMGCDTTSFGINYRKENYFNQNNKPVILFVGRLARVKGIEYLIKAVDGLDAKLVIVGSGDQESTLKDLAKSVDCEIDFFGAKTHDQLSEIYASADVFVAPSVTLEDGAKEGFGLVVLEAMASSLPVVVSNSGGLPEIVKDKENGFVFQEKNVDQLKNILNLLIENTSLRKEYAAKSLKSVQKWDYSNIAKRYEQVIVEKMEDN